jgi:hypothetical protein
MSILGPILLKLAEERQPKLNKEVRAQMFDLRKFCLLGQHVMIDVATPIRLLTSKISFVKKTNPPNLTSTNSYIHLRQNIH